MYTIYHNPRCRKSRETLQILHDQGVTPTVVLYIDTPLSKKTLKEIAGLLKMSPIEFTRKAEEPFKELKAKVGNLSDEQIFDCMVENPIIIERPIVVKHDSSGKAVSVVLGRPPINVLSMIQ